MQNFKKKKVGIRRNIQNIKFLPIYIFTGFIIQNVFRIFNICIYNIKSACGDNKYDINKRRLKSYCSLRVHRLQSSFLHTLSLAYPWTGDGVRGEIAILISGNSWLGEMSLRLLSLVVILYLIIYYSAGHMSRINYWKALRICQ